MWVKNPERKTNWRQLSLFNFTNSMKLFILFFKCFSLFINIAFLRFIFYFPINTNTRFVLLIIDLWHKVHFWSSFPSYPGMIPSMTTCIRYLYASECGLVIAFFSLLWCLFTLYFDTLSVRLIFWVHLSFIFQTFYLILLHFYSTSISPQSITCMSSVLKRILSVFLV